MNFPQPDRGRKIGGVFKWQPVNDAAQAHTWNAGADARQHVEWKHVPREQVLQKHVGKYDARHFQKPEAEHAEGRFEEESQQKRKEQR